MAPDGRIPTTIPFSSSSSSSLPVNNTASPSRSTNGKIGYNPVGTWVPPQASQDPINAYEVSRTKRVSQVIVAVAYSLLAAGIVFGFAALKPVLVDDGVYWDRCRQDELRGDARTCYRQESRYEHLFLPWPLPPPQHPRRIICILIE